MPSRFTSIIIASYITNELREKMFRTSMDSLLESVKDLPVETILIDNGGTPVDEYEGKVNCIIKNRENIHFGLARNQGISSAHGNFICIADNDILYKKGWLEACLEVLEKYPDKKIYATPIKYPETARYNSGELPGGIILDMRAGSNCFVVRRKDMEIVGNFLAHRVAGTKWTNKAVRLGYLAAVVPGDLITDLGFRQGYNHSEPIPIKKILSNGEEIMLNVDEYRSL